jgi:hypothetical protein
MDNSSLTYVERRALNIARNAERMRAIGLTTIDVTALSPAVIAHKQKRVLPTSSQILNGDADLTESEPSGTLHLRRSGRTSGGMLIFCAQVFVMGLRDCADVHPGVIAPSYNDNLHEPSPPRLDRVRATAFKSGTPRQPPLAAAGSSRSMMCDVDKLLQFHIGRAIIPRDGQVKRAVMQLSSSSGVCPSFNRMSGITEWANCVFLFVNVGGSDYENLLYFSRSSAPRVEDLAADDCGAACAVMTWFAQPRQDGSTPVLLRLQSSDAHPTLVFFRVVGVPEFIFGGRLQCVC